MSNKEAIDLLEDGLEVADKPESTIMREAIRILKSEQNKKLRAELKSESEPEPGEFTKEVRDSLEFNPKLGGNYAISAYDWLKEKLLEACGRIDRLLAENKKFRDIKILPKTYITRIAELENDNLELQAENKELKKSFEGCNKCRKHYEAELKAKDKALQYAQRLMEWAEKQCHTNCSVGYVPMMPHGDPEPCEWCITKGLIEQALKEKP